jgi:hypothetical protein
MPLYDLLRPSHLGLIRMNGYVRLVHLKMIPGVAQLGPGSEVLRFSSLLPVRKLFDQQPPS